MCRMMSFPLQTVLLALFVLALVARTGAAPRGQLLRLLQNGSAPKDNEDISRILLLKLLSELASPSENDVLSVADGLDVRNDIVRQLPLSQRERKAGCRNFFWKTFTSC